MAEPGAGAAGESATIARMSIRPCHVAALVAVLAAPLSAVAPVRVRPRS